MMGTIGLKFLVLGFFVQVAVSQRPPVFHLSQENFEHDTQAASGQTTGTWFVLFGRSDTSETYRVWETLAKEQREHNPHLLFAFVDRYDSPALFDRFQLTGLPVFLLFQDRKVYRYDGSVEIPGLKERLADFVSSGYKHLPGSKVPTGPHHVSLPISTNMIIILSFIAGIAIFLYFAYWSKWIQADAAIDAPGSKKHTH